MKINTEIKYKDKIFALKTYIDDAKIDENWENLIEGLKYISNSIVQTVITQEKKADDYLKEFIRVNNVSNSKIWEISCDNEFETFQKKKKDKENVVICVNPYRDKNYFSERLK